jgi:hypothetical protein
MVRYNPEAVWPVPEGFRSIYAHGAELRSNARLLFVSGQIGNSQDGSLATDFDAQCEAAMTNVEALLAAAAMTQNRYRQACLLSDASGRSADARRTPSKALGVVDPADGNDACGGGSRSPGIVGRNRGDRRGDGSRALVDIRKPAQRRAEDLAGLADQRGARHLAARLGEGAGDADADRARTAEQWIVIPTGGVALDQHLALEGVVPHRVAADVIEISVAADDLAVAEYDHAAAFASAPVQ